MFRAALLALLFACNNFVPETGNRRTFCERLCTCVGNVDTSDNPRIDCVESCLDVFQSRRTTPGGPVQPGRVEISDDCRECVEIQPCGGIADACRDTCPDTYVNFEAARGTHGHPTDAGAQDAR